MAARYDVSSSYMARVCTLLNVPRPERGYWAKLAVGKAPPKPPLPEARPGDETVWTKGGGPYSRKRKTLPRPPSKRHKQKIKPSASKLRKHPLISGAKHHFEHQIYFHDVGYLKPTKKLLVDLVVSKPCLDKALSFANKLFLLLDKPDMGTTDPIYKQIYFLGAGGDAAPARRSYFFGASKIT